jgi:hypothetical protein
MAKNGLENLLVQLRLEGTGTVFFRNKKDEFVDALTIDNPRKIELHFDIQKKLELIQPTAIYVFNNQPFILFFDLTDEKNKERENDIHKKVWSFDKSPVIFVIKKNETIVYNALNYVKKEEQLQEIPFETEDARNKQFSFWNLQSGFTWKWLQEKYLIKHKQKRVNEKLFFFF